MQTSTFTNRNSYGTGDAPLGSTSSGDSAFGDTRLSRPFRFTQGFSQSGQMSIVAFIQSLFSRSSPLHISDFVMTVYVKTFNGMLRRRFASDMFQKLFVGFKAKFNTTPAIVSIMSSARRIASFFSTLIRPIFGRFFSVTGFAVANIQMRAFNFPTPTRQLSHAFQDSGFNCKSVATVAQAMPLSVTVGGDTGKTNDKQTSKALTCENFNAIFTNGIGVCSKVVSSQDVFSLLENIAVRVVESFRFLRPAFIIT